VGEPGATSRPDVLPHLRLDELLAELQVRLQAVLGARDQMRGLLEAVVERLSLFEDRDRIARDLHDLVIQRLYATGMSLERPMPMITRPEVATRIGNAVDAMDDTIKDIRATIFALQARGVTGMPDVRGDIVCIVEEMTPLLGFAPSLRLGAGLGEQDSGAVSAKMNEQALAALREALSNAARHSGATQVDVTVDINSGGSLTVLVTDDGTGISPGVGRSGLRNWPAEPRHSAASCCSIRSARVPPGQARGWNGGYPAAYPARRRPFTMPGVIRMKYSFSPMTQGRRPIVRSQAISTGSVTSRD